MASSETYEVTKYYEQWWENPKDTRNTVFCSLNSYVFSRIPRGEGKTALDLGSGRGTIVSYLLHKGYRVVAVEFSEKLADYLRTKFPTVKVINRDIRDLRLKNHFDLTTCIEVTQNLKKDELRELIGSLRNMTDKLIINIDNGLSMHARWRDFRGFTRGFVTSYTPREFIRIVEESGFKVTHRRGIGLVTPVTLYQGFRVNLIPTFVTKLTNTFDPLLGGLCHLYYIEAETR